MHIRGATINSRHFACAGHELHLKFDELVAPTQWTSYFFHSRLPRNIPLRRGRPGEWAAENIVPSSMNLSYCTILMQPSLLAKSSKYSPSGSEGEA
jgi:hypothetical protein